MGFSTNAPGMFNRYAYTLNDPVNMTDPDGECPICISGVVGAGIGAIVGGGIEAYKQAKAGKGFDAGKIASSAVKGALVGAAVGVTGGAAMEVVALTGATGAGAAATVALPTAAVGATGNAIVSITDDMADGTPAPVAASNSVKSFVTGGLGAGAGGAASPSVTKAISKMPRFGGVGNVNGAGAAVGETAANVVSTAVTEGANVVPLPEAELEKDY